MSGTRLVSIIWVKWGRDKACNSEEANMFCKSDHSPHPSFSFLFATLSLLYGEGNGTQLQYSCLENHLDGGAWWAAVHGVAKRRTRLSDFTFTFHFHALEKEMTTHSGVLAWRISGTVEPGGLLSMGLHRVGHDWRHLAAAAASCISKRLALVLLSRDG